MVCKYISFFIHEYIVYYVYVVLLQCIERFPHCQYLIDYSCIVTQIHIVMEKMNGDMLEMILSSPSSRLTERVTRFLTHQVS